MIITWILVSLGPLETFLGNNKTFNNENTARTAAELTSALLAGRPAAVTSPSEGEAVRGLGRLLELGKCFPVLVPK